MGIKQHIGLPDWSGAAAHLSATDPRMAAIIDRVGPCTLVPRKNYFASLCKSIYAQQVSTTVANILFNRFRTNFPGGRPTPARTLELFRSENCDAIAKQCGLSRQKRKYLIDLATHFADNRIPSRSLRTMPEEEIIERLTEVHGVGVWTVQMFLIFVLNRPDVLPVADLGLKQGVKNLFNLRELPKPARLEKLTEAWRPYRSVGTWYMWRSLALPAK